MIQNQETKEQAAAPRLTRYQWADTTYCFDSPHVIARSIWRSYDEFHRSGARLATIEDVFEQRLAHINSHPEVAKTWRGYFTTGSAVALHPDRKGKIIRDAGLHARMTPPIQAELARANQEVWFFKENYKSDSALPHGLTISQEQYDKLSGPELKLTLTEEMSWERMPEHKHPIWSALVPNEDLRRAHFAYQQAFNRKHYGIGRRQQPLLQVIHRQLEQPAIVPLAISAFAGHSYLHESRFDWGYAVLGKR